MEMSFDNIIKNNEARVSVVAIRRKKGEDEETEQYMQLQTKEVSCLYSDRNGVFILKKNGILIKVKHTLDEIAPYFTGDLTPYERAN